MRSISDLLCELKAAAPARAENLTPEQIERLRALTRELLELKPQAPAEYRRFEGVRRRGIDLPKQELAARLEGSVVLVTGGTGCIGRVLLRELRPYRPARVVSVTRGRTPLPDLEASPELAGVEFVHGDVRHRAGLDELFDEVRPDVVFHVAAQRDPGLAEAEVRRTVATNVFGTLNVVRAAARAGTESVVCASTGKALRPYSPDIYTASKRAAEWVAADHAASGDLLCSAARFTHVVDNSIIYRRLQSWATGQPDAPIRLHGTSIAFYAQSALESAQLLLFAFLGAERGEFRMHAISDLGWPVCLLDLALGVLSETGARVPVYFSGYDAGYEQVPFPGLYDPLTAVDVSPLLNAYEAAVSVSPTVPGADAFWLRFASDARLYKMLSRLDDSCASTRDPVPLRQELDELSWALLDATLRTAPRTALLRSAALAKARWDTMSQDHRRVLEAICDVAGNP